MHTPSTSAYQQVKCKYYNKLWGKRFDVFMFQKIAEGTGMSKISELVSNKDFWVEIFLSTTLKKGDLKITVLYHQDV